MAVAKVSDAGGDWAQALALVTMLVRHWKRMGPIRADLSTTYTLIVSGVGYCSDYVRVYLAASNATGLFCRQWAFSFDGFGGHGHTCVEIYDRQRGKWVFVDVLNNVYAVAAGQQEPLSVLELRSACSQDLPHRIPARRSRAARLRALRQAPGLLSTWRRPVVSLVG